MTDPERLIASGSELERSLLLAAASEKPSAALLVRMERGVGIAQTASSALAAKFIALAIGTAMVGGGAVALLGGETSDSKPLASAQGVGDAFAARVEGLPAAFSPLPAPPSLGEGARGADAEEPRSAESASAEPHQISSKVASSPGVSRDRLREEVAQLDRVRVALGAGNPVRARQLLTSYDRRFPNGVLAPEARKLRQSAAGQ